MLRIATAAVMIASYADAVRWNWQELLDASTESVSTAEGTVEGAVTARKAADQVLADGIAVPDSAATKAALLQIQCKSAFEFEIEMFASCSHAAAEDYAAGNFGPPSHPVAYSGWLDAYHACSTEADKFMSPLQVDSKPCEPAYTAKHVTKPTVTWPTAAQGEKVAAAKAAAAKKA